MKCKYHNTSIDIHLGAKKQQAEHFLVCDVIMFPYELLWCHTYNTYCVMMFTVYNFGRNLKWWGESPMNIYFCDYCNTYSEMSRYEWMNIIKVWCSMWFFFHTCFKEDKAWSDSSYFIKNKCNGNYGWTLWLPAILHASLQKRDIICK